MKNYFVFFPVFTFSINQIIFVSSEQQKRPFPFVLKRSDTVDKSDKRSSLFGQADSKVSVIYG